MKLYIQKFRDTVFLSEKIIMAQLITFLNILIFLLSTVSAEDSPLPNFSKELPTPVFASGSTTGRPISDRLAEVFNVKDWGAKGDGKSDDLAAIQSAISAAEVVGGGIVEFPSPGKYYLGHGENGLLVQGGKVNLVGHGSSDSVILDGSGLTAGAIILLGDGVYTHNTEIVSLRLVGCTSTIGISCAGKESSKAIVDCAFRDLTISNCHIGIKSTYTFCNIFENIRISSCTSSLEAGAQSNNNLFNRCSFTGGHRNISCINCGGLQFNSCNINNTLEDEAAVSLSKSQVVFENPYFENIASSVLVSVGIRSENSPNNSSLVINGGVCNVLNPIIRLNSYHPFISCDGLTCTKGVPIISNDLDGGNAFYLRYSKWLFNGSSISSCVEPLASWRGERPIPFGCTSKNGKIFTEIRKLSSLVHTDTPETGILLSNSLTLGHPYTLVYAMRTSGLCVSCSTLGSHPMAVQDNSESLEIRYLPFCADNKSIALIFDKAFIDLDISLLQVIPGTSFTPSDLGLARLLFAPIPPTSGSWLIGDVLFNSTPSSGLPKFWQCTASGTPGSWIDD